jgi:ABC-type polar amino acid transport system ATPase subunit
MFIVKKLSKKFDSNQILSEISLELDKGEIGVLNGASGSGKSTLLECLAGTVPYDTGEVLINGSPFASGKPHPGVSLAFQSSELFPNYDAISNIILPLVLVKKMNKMDARKKAMKLLEEIGLEEKAEKNISSLSGGQQLRLAIARARAVEPALLLLDEPSAALDSDNTDKIVKIVKELSKQGIMFLIASHDFDFIKKLQKESKKVKLLTF